MGHYGNLFTGAAGSLKLLVPGVDSISDLRRKRRGPSEFHVYFDFLATVKPLALPRESTT